MGITPNMETPDNVNAEESTESSPDSSQGQAESILDLDTVERFRFSGQEWTPKDFQSSLMRQQDYSRKTQDLAKERRFVENFAFDARRVLKEPSLLSEFERHYPKNYTDLLRAALQEEQESQTQQDAKGTRQGANIDPSIAQKLEKYDRLFDSIEKEKHQTEIQKFETEIDQTMGKLNEKYPNVKKFEDAVLAKAEMYYAKNGSLTPDTWEKIYKQVDGVIKGISDEYYKKQFNSQKQANLQGKDVASGGGIPSQAPEKIALKDVKYRMQAALDAKR